MRDGALKTEKQTRKSKREKADEKKLTKSENPEGKAALGRKIMIACSATGVHGRRR